MRRHLLPLRLVQILADMLCVGVVGGVPLNGDGPVISGPKNVDAGVAGTSGPSAESGKQVNCSAHINSLYHARYQGTQSCDN